MAISFAKTFRQRFSVMNVTFIAFGKSMSARFPIQFTLTAVIVPKTTFEGPAPAAIKRGAAVRRLVLRQRAGAFFVGRIGNPPMLVNPFRVVFAFLCHLVCRSPKPHRPSAPSAAASVLSQGAIVRFH